MGEIKQFLSNNKNTFYQKEYQFKLSTKKPSELLQMVYDCIKVIFIIEHRFYKTRLLKKSLRHLHH